MAEEVKLLGWGSPFLYRVVWALKLKGIPYELIQDDIRNKSQLLLQLNPIHKKIPVFIHNGKSICESMIIVQYIDENWPQVPLLPSDPYEKAVTLFWVKFADDKLPAALTLLQTSGEKQEKARTELVELLHAAEEHSLVGKKFFGGDSINMADIAFGLVAHWMEIFEEASGVKIFDADKFPRLHEWAKDFKQVTVIRENLPDHDVTLAKFKRFREEKLASTKG